LQALDSADEAEPGRSALTKDELAAKIAALQEKQDWHAELLAQLQDGDDKQVSVTDPDTRKMPTAYGMLVGYNAQMAVDAKHKLIAADDVTNEVTDYQQLANVALEAKANLEVKQAEVVADVGYYNAAEVSRCVEAGLTPMITKADTSANTARGFNPLISSGRLARQTAKATPANKNRFTASGSGITAIPNSTLSMTSLWRP
jgi:transposase